MTNLPGMHVCMCAQVEQENKEKNALANARKHAQADDEAAKVAGKKAEADFKKNQKEEKRAAKEAEKAAKKAAKAAEKAAAKPANRCEASGILLMMAGIFGHDEPGWCIVSLTCPRHVYIHCRGGRKQKAENDAEEAPPPKRK
jgi:hypothetical protein